MRKLFLLIAVAALVAACTSINCPLNNTVAAVWRFSATLDGSLTVSANLHDGGDTVLINAQSSTDSLKMPMSYASEADTFTLTYAEGDSVLLADRLIIKKTDTQHFESIECSPSVFHHIDGVEFDGVFIDSVSIRNPNVTYNTVSANIIIHTSLGVD